MRLLYLIVLLFLSSLVYGQKSILLQNTNSRAKELKHFLNKTEDSIAFKCDRTIYELMIFNDDGFERVIKVKDTVAKIKISDIPVGRYAVEAVLEDKLIIITLLRNESFVLEEPTTLIARNTSLKNNKLIAPKTSIGSTKTTPKQLQTFVKTTTVLDSLTEKSPYKSESAKRKTDLILAGKKESPATEETKNTVTSPRTNLISNRLLAHNSDAAKSTTKKQARRSVANSAPNNSKYWVIYKMNNGTRSEKVLKIADQKTVDRMIRKIEIDMRTASGKLNELTVWQIYDTTKFVRHKRMNQLDYMNIESDSFNIVPYYKAGNNSEK